MTDIIKIKKLIKTFDQRVVINNIDLSIKEGEFICLIGPSGEGKTTLLNLIGGFIEKDSGNIKFQGKEIRKPTRDCIMVFQEFDQLFPWKTLKDNIQFPLINGVGTIPIGQKKLTKKEIQDISLKYIKMVKLEGFEEYYPNQLSGGMKQRTAIARALVTSPRVLLMDEPFGSLDAQTKSSLHSTLLDIWGKTNTTIIFVTHDVREALTLADRIVLLKEGIIREIIDNNEKIPTDKKVAEITRLL